MEKIEWKTNNYKTIADHKIPCSSNLEDGFKQGSGIKPSSNLMLFFKQVFWPFLNFRNGLLIDGFIEREIGKYIKKYISTDSVFLEIGCGDMNLKKYVQNPHWYNCLDLEISDFHILRTLKNSNNINLVLASATEIPTSSNTASLIVSTETFEHIPEIDEAIVEIHRVAKSDAHLICSIPNNYCYKYMKKGAHEKHVNNWKNEEFIEYMKSHNFEYIEGFMKGKWIPFPLWLTKTSYQLPLTSKSEYYNTNFFYVFRVIK